MKVSVFGVDPFAGFYGFASGMRPGVDGWRFTEPISDTARVLSGYASAIAIRTFAQADVQRMARSANVPVINALTDDHDP